MNVLCPETREELRDVLARVWPDRFVLASELFSFLNMTSPLDRAKFYSLAGCKQCFTVDEVSDVLWESSNYGEAEAE
jgi:hypothetical protein